MNAEASRITCIFGVVLTTAVLATAQDTTGTIGGVVRDPSEAVVATARITVSNQETGLTRSVDSNASGEYRVPFLPVGTYSVRAQKEGFKSQVQTRIKLEILQVRTVDFRLELGTLAETVTVESRAPLLEAETSQAGQVIKNEQVNNLPLNVRQFLQLTFLAPMAVPATGDYRSVEVSRDTAVPASAGQRPEQNNYQIDGIDNREQGRNNFAISPPVDSVTEFKVQTGLAPAEFGRGGGTIINVVTKSGTNDFHGTAYEFLRNNKLDARPFFSNRTNPLKRNQFGAALGGPVMQNKLFFFGNYEGFRQASSGNPPVGTVLTEDQRNGIFTTPILDPQTKQPFPNKTIPKDRLSPISMNIVKLLPLPNNPRDPARNFVFNAVPSVSSPRDDAVTRMDGNLGEKNTIYGRYLFDQESAKSPPYFPAPANSGGRDFILRAQGISAHWNHILSPATINNFSLGYMRYRNRLATLNSYQQDFIAPSGITNTLSAVDPLFWASPSISIPGYLMTGDSTPNYRTTNTYQLLESVYWTRGSNSIKFGGDLRDLREYMFYTGGNGSWSFSNLYSGDNVADFLLGYPSQVSKTARATQWNSRLHYLGAFVQDDWKVTPKLTLNFGLRYEVESALKQIDNCGLGFDAAGGAMLISQYCTNLPLIEAFYRDIRPDVKYRVTDHRAPYDTDTNNLAPRFGFAYRLTSQTVIRGGYGIYIDSPQIQPMASSNDFAPNTLRPIWTANPQVPDLSYNPEGASKAEATLKNAPLTIFPFTSRNFPYGRVQQWSLNVQRQIGSLVAEVIYQGSNSVHLLVNDNIDSRAPAPGNVQQLLPFPQFARIQNSDMWGAANFQGASIKIEQRPWHGLSYLAAYTFSKSIDLASTWDVGAQWTDPFNRRSARGPSDFDARNRFSAAYEYALPIGRGKPLAGGVSTGVDKLISGWGVRGITFLQTGLPQSPTMSLSRTGVCAAACSARPDRIGDGNLPKSERTIDRFYDVNAFRLLAPGGADRRIGNAGRNVLVSAGINNFDVQVFKDTRIRERQLVELRWEMFNAWNHTQFGAAGTSLESAATFGKITSTRAPRIMQFVLKYGF